MKISFMYLLIFILIPILLISYQVLKTGGRKYLSPQYPILLLSVIKECSPAQSKHCSATCSNAAHEILLTTAKVPEKQERFMNQGNR